GWTEISATSTGLLPQSNVDRPRRQHITRGSASQPNRVSPAHHTGALAMTRTLFESLSGRKAVRARRNRRVRSLQVEAVGARRLLAPSAAGRDGGRFAGEPAGAPGGLEVVAADQAVEVQDLAGEVQAGNSPAFQRPGIDLVERDATAGDL